MGRIVAMSMRDDDQNGRTVRGHKLDGFIVFGKPTDKFHAQVVASRIVSDRQDGQVQPVGKRQVLFIVSASQCHRLVRKDRVEIERRTWCTRSQG